MADLVCGSMITIIFYLLFCIWQVHSLLNESGLIFVTSVNKIHSFFKGAVGDPGLPGDNGGVGAPVRNSSLMC